MGALAAGNAVVLKPSEISPASSAILARLIPQYLDSSAVQVVEGGPEVGIALLEHRWDNIFFTGEQHHLRATVFFLRKLSIARSLIGPPGGTGRLKW